ncbi:hypothetical protein QAD02_021922 [Eretmocerus hayati]|uniref:Uncharacterized protein n=1 Tax=Eretmocerus hayati TaxID=131215 RepID=A0ACC2PT11_9HYME|nr:hypothetical protein QAD02_021922 [Eretmocerus hayati]
MMNPCVVDNDIKEHTTLDLDEALRFINESEEEWLKYPENIFRAVRRGIDLDVPSLYDSDTVINVETREQVCPGIFQACSEQLQASKVAKYLRELDKEHVSEYSFLTREDVEHIEDAAYPSVNVVRPVSKVWALIRLPEVEMEEISSTGPPNKPIGARDIQRE